MVRVITSKRIRWAGGGGHVVSVAQRRNAYMALMETQQRKMSLERTGRRWVILKWILKKFDGLA